jgi:hypothetical protein
VAQAGYGKDRRELALAESKLQCHLHAPGAPLALRRIRSIPWLDSWSGYQPAGTQAMYAAGHCAANTRLARRPASSPSSITTNSRK